MDEIIDKAQKMKHRLTSIHELKAGKWLIGYKLVQDLKASMYKGQAIDDEKFLGVPYLIDYKEKETLLLATNPLE